MRPKERHLTISFDQPGMDLIEGSQFHSLLDHVPFRSRAVKYFAYMGVVASYQSSKLDLRKARGTDHRLQDPLRRPDKFACCFYVNHIVHVAIVTGVVADVKE
jgi:hypothetical protein